MIVDSSAEMSTEERDGGSKTWLVERDVIASDQSWPPAPQRHPGGIKSGPSRGN